MSGIKEKIKKFVSDPYARFTFLNEKGFYDVYPDKAFLKKKYKIRLGRTLHLDHPKTFTEKLQWLKIYNRNPQYTQMVDKYEAKNYVASKIGATYIIPTLGVWNHFDEIDFDALPNRFVLKCTHDSGGLVICKDKSTFDRAAAKEKTEASLRKNYYRYSREWPYKNVKPRIIAECYMADDSVKRIAGEYAGDGLLDYKFYCFNGEPKFLYVGFANIQNNRKQDLLSFFDLDWNPTPFYRKDHEPLPFSVEKPPRFEDMIAVAKKLSCGIPFVRVDLYYIREKIYFSELTFSPGGGFGKFYPDAWEETIGDWIHLPKK